MYKKEQRVGKIFLARHAECYRNCDKRKRVGGRHNSSLTSNGKIQKRKLAAVVRSLNIGRIISSKFRRAVETAEACAEVLGLEVELMEDLAERHYGELENKPLSEIYKRATKYIHIGGRIHVLRGPGVETLTRLRSRVKPIYRKVKKETARSEQNTLIVCHEGVIRMIRSLHNGTPLSQHFSIGSIGNTEIIGLD